VQRKITARTTAKSKAGIRLQRGIDGGSPSDALQSLVVIEKQPQLKNYKIPLQLKNSAAIHFVGIIYTKWAGGKLLPTLKTFLYDRNKATTTNILLLLFKCNMLI